MENEEKLIKNKMSIASIVASLMLLSIVLLGASYAFFSDKLQGTSEELNFGNGLNVSFTLDAGNSIDFDFNPLEMTNNTVDNTYIDSDEGNGTVTLVNNSGKENVTCEYEVWYKANDTFNNNDKKKDIALITKITNESDTENEVNLNDVTPGTDKKISEEHITADNNGNKTKTQNWTFKFRHFILKDDIQNEHLGQHFSGQVYFKAKKCYEGTYKEKAES